MIIYILMEENRNEKLDNIVFSSFFGALLIMFLFSYREHYIPEIPKQLKGLMNNFIFKMIMLYLIVYFIDTDQRRSLIITVILIVILTLLNNIEKKNKKKNKKD